MAGVYGIIHIPTGAAYIGGSVDPVNRFAFHRCYLRKRKHHSSELQKLWDSTTEDHWVFVVLEKCGAGSHSGRALREREQHWMDKWPARLLNARPTRGYKFDPITISRIKAAAQRRVEIPGHREMLSQRAKKQHQEGKLGRQTWRT